jgi:hypothetical protein
VEQVRLELAESASVERLANARAKPPKGAPLDSPVLPPKFRDFNRWRAAAGAVRGTTGGTSSSSRAALPRSVLIIDQSGPGLPFYAGISSGIRAAMISGSATRVPSIMNSSMSVDFAAPSTSTV